MGVFARIFRRSKTTEETQAAGTGAEGAATEPPRTEDAAGAVEPKASDEAPKTAEPAVKEAEEVTGESVDIPKQQQSSDAADSETGEGART
ncbi:hypothetical protein CD934_08125 [Streptomyces calvus]|jgi:hypothetical protein|uniref:Gliding motility protein n=1 Tax=Streptomyces calvus TaxID=67282 RepID=A0A514JMV2_9ACTN|nr:hypothetical protein [Streptomyces calvus]QDI68654.1 hypothetical protein CD934_08125 [Streptomyces calvus]